MRAQTMHYVKTQPEPLWQSVQEKMCCGCEEPAEELAEKECFEIKALLDAGEKAVIVAHFLLKEDGRAGGKEWGTLSIRTILPFRPVGKAELQDLEQTWLSKNTSTRALVGLFPQSQAGKQEVLFQCCSVTCTEKN